MVAMVSSKLISSEDASSAASFAMLLALVSMKKSSTCVNNFSRFSHFCS